MTNQREPQVGDVYISWLPLNEKYNKEFQCLVTIDSLWWKYIKYTLIAFIAWPCTIKCNKKSFIREWFEADELEFMKYWYYLWKLAPRYKRLFWVYYINDKKQWVTKN